MSDAKTYIEPNIYKSGSGKFRVTVYPKLPNGKKGNTCRSFDTLEEARHFKQNFNGSLDEVNKIPKQSTAPTAKKKKPSIMQIQANINPDSKGKNSDANQASYITIISKDPNMIKNLLKDLEF